MKTKTRILAMLLTVLMVVGILPLSLFALDENPNGSSNTLVAEDRTLEDIQAEFENKGITLGKYQSFEKLTNEDLNTLVSENGQIQLNTSEYNDYDDQKGEILIADQKPAFSIVTEAGGNKALYLGNAENKVYSNNENFIAVSGFDNDGDKTQDLFLSMDIKMAGDKISVPVDSLINIVYRTTGPNMVKTLYVSADGRLYMSSSFDEDSYVGSLSKDAYTRIAVSIERATNKFYIYINDVLVNEGGTQLFSDSDVENFNTYANSTAYTAKNLPINSFRCYIVRTNIEGNNNHDGIYFDNITYGRRYSIGDKQTTDKVYVQSDFKNAVDGYPVAPNPNRENYEDESWRDVQNATGDGWPIYEDAFGTYDDGALVGCLHQKSVVYVDEDGDKKVDAIKWQRAKAKSDIGTDQAWIDVRKQTTNNFRLSMDLKMGEGGVCGNNKFIYFKIINVSEDQNLVSLAGGDGSKDSDGTLKADNTVLGKLSKTEYLTLTIDVVTNGPDAALIFIYVNGELKYTKAVFVPNMKLQIIRIYPIFNDGVANLKVDDLHMKNFVFMDTDDYNDASGHMAPFAKILSGFVEVNGITRYYDGKGGYATEDFYIGTTKYIVRTNGEIVNKVSGALPQRTLEEIQTAFAAQGVDLRVYQSFNNWEFDEGETSYVYPAGTITEKQNAATYAEYSADGDSTLALKNYRGSYSVVTEAEGNKALYMAESEGTSSNYDNFVDFVHGLPQTYNGQNGDATRDFFVSGDFKMNGVNILGGILYNLIYRPEAYGLSDNPMVSVSEVGGIYIGGNYSPDNLVGFLSQDEYTRIAFATDRANNKYYVYINDVLVNPEGSELFSQEMVDRMNEKHVNNSDGYTAQTVPICEIRTYNATAHYNTSAHKGIFMDNLLLGYREIKPADRISVFENKLAGLHGIGGIVRYYNGDSTFKTSNFELDGEKYLVGYGGTVIGPESEGREIAPYAPYVDWNHEGTMLISSPAARYLAAEDGATLQQQTYIEGRRDGFWKKATMPNGDGVTLYTSYYDEEVGISQDHSTYIAIDFENGLKNTDVTIDFDVMLGDFFIEDDASSQTFITITGKENSDGTGGDKNQNFPIFMTGDGWLTYNGKKVAKLNMREFTRFSIVVHGPRLDASDNLTASKIDVYANGVMIIDGAIGQTGAKYLKQIRFLKMCDVDFSGYFKDLYMYASAKPQQFVSMVDGVPTLTSDQNATPAKAADIKQGLVSENGVVRYYDELGLPVIGTTVTADGNTYKADVNGKIACDGKNHILIKNSMCMACGTKLDGISSLYGNSLTLGSDVKVIFYLDIDAAKAAGASVEYGLERDYANETTVVTPVNELETEKIDGKTYYKVTYAVSGKDICSNIKVRVVKADGSYGTEYSYSAAQYAEDVQELPTDSVYTEELKALAKALAVYGKNAAAVLANGAEAEEITNVDFDDVDDAYGTKDYDGAVKLVKFSLELKSNVKIKVYFSFDEIAAEDAGYYMEDYEVKVMSGETDVTENAVVTKVGENEYCIEYTIVAAKLGDVFTFSILNDDTDSGLELNLSAIQYAKIMNDSAKTSDAEKNLMKAIKLYADAAAAYAAAENA